MITDLTIARLAKITQIKRKGFIFFLYLITFELDVPKCAMLLTSCLYELSCGEFMSCFITPYHIDTFQSFTICKIIKNASFEKLNRKLQNQYLEKTIRFYQ